MVWYGTHASQMVGGAHLELGLESAVGGPPADAAVCGARDHRPPERRHARHRGRARCTDRRSLWGTEGNGGRTDHQSRPPHGGPPIPIATINTNNNTDHNNNNTINNDGYREKSRPLNFLHTMTAMIACPSPPPSAPPPTSMSSA